ncbi:hypothetical protein Pan216_45010 [Planctomycetes bacterium Pan216]|uniref:Uncharacterized protein n=1 Tax=Kolteria novifilia TaxID=2527975 RepID=A0A518B9F2_9BACT|nr:hypothetical protein Pan216_45010 [Planctomycetes bacterium Pan216]
MNTSGSNQQLLGDPKQLVRTLQIIVAALCMGVLTFAGVATAISLGVIEKDVPQAAAPEGESPADIITIAALAMAAMSLVAHPIVGSIITKTPRSDLQQRLRDGDEESVDRQLAGLFQTSTIIRCAILEGPAFFLLIALILGGPIWLLAVVAVLLIAIAIHLPTEASFEGWRQRQKEDLKISGF